MEEAKRARKAETPKQPSRHLRSSAPYFYPDPYGLQSIAVGSKEFVEKIKEKLGALFLSRKVEGKEDRYELHDPQRPYRLTENTFPWRDL